MTLLTFFVSLAHLYRLRHAKVCPRGIYAVTSKSTNREDLDETAYAGL